MMDIMTIVTQLLHTALLLIGCCTGFCVLVTVIIFLESAYLEFCERMEGKEKKNT